jgi:tetratricopeptide (TPR) repeat protein
MAVDKNKVVAEATKLVQKGQFDKAIKAYEKILAEDPKDVRVLLKIGELQQKKGDNGAAAETFGRVADAYGEQGFFLKAVAVYKQMLKLAPDDVRVNERLAGLYQQLGILSDAMAQLQVVATAAEKSGDEPKLLEILRRMVELEPENVGSAVKLGELYAKQDKTKLALEHLRRAADQLRRNNRTEEYVKVAERITFLDHEDLGLTRELANIYLAKGDTKRALAKLQMSFKADPKDAETLTLLAQAFKDLGQISKTVSVYKELAHLQAERGRPDEARTTWRRVLELVPDDQEALQGAGAGRPTGTTAAPPSAPRPAPTSAPATTTAPPRPPPRPATAASAPAATSASGSTPARTLGPEAIPKLLTETDVYVKYGLHDKALEHLKRIFAIDPENLDAHEKALQLRAARRDAAGAAESAAAVVRLALARGAADRAQAAVARLRETAPDHPQLAALAQQAKAAQGAAAPMAEEEVILEPVADDEVILEVEAPLIDASAGGTGDDELVDDDSETGAEALVEEGEGFPQDEAAQLEEEAFPAVGDDMALAAAGEAHDDVVDEEPPVTGELPLGTEFRREPEPPPPPPARPARPAAPAAKAPAPTPAPARPALVPPPPPAAAAPAKPAKAPPAPPRAAEPPPRAAPARAPAPPPAAAAPKRPAPAPVPAPPAKPPPPAARHQAPEDEEDLDQEIEEAGFFVQQGLMDEAHEVLKNLLSFHPSHKKLRAKLAEVEQAMAAGSAPAQPQGEGDESFDIARELAEELGAAPAAPAQEEEFQYSVEDVFNQFKRGVAETVKPEDSETHYDLGIAYKEMGLLDDAIHEFEVALSGKNKKKEVDCLTMIGLLRMEKGDAAAAADAYQRALRSDYLTPDAARAVHYELAGAYQATGDKEAALYFLQKVVKADPAYRDAKALVAQLGGGPGKAPADAEGARPAGAEASASSASRMGPKKNIGYV